MIFSASQQQYTLQDISQFLPSFPIPSLVFLFGSVGSGKTTFVSNYIEKYTGVPADKVTSPTYVYYNIYPGITHFDLYRLKNYDAFVSIGGEEILQNNTGIIFIEWPELLGNYYKPDYIVTLSHCEQREDVREIKIEKA